MIYLQIQAVLFFSGKEAEVFDILIRFFYNKQQNS